LAEVTASLNDPQGPLHTTLNNISTTSRHVEQITGGVQKGTGSLGSLISTRELMDEILARLDQVDIILQDIGSAAAKTPVAMDHVNSGLGTLNNTSEKIDNIVVQVTSLVNETQKSAQLLKIILENIETGSRDVPRITSTTKEGIAEIRKGVSNIDKVVQSLQKNILIRGNLPQNPELNEASGGLR
jgi:phospholipid/cholesterol/gamma-HCH transport system substrate-binding protein